MRQSTKGRIIRMRRKGRSWTEISEQTGLTVSALKEVVEERKLQLRKEMAELRANMLEFQKQKDSRPVIDLDSLFGKPSSHYQSGHASQYKGIYYKDFSKSDEQYEKERNDYLEFLLLELGKLG